MDRRSFLKNTAIGGSTAAAATLAAPAYAQGRRTLTLVTTWGRGLAGVHDSAQYCADMITAATDGALTVELKAAGELVGAFEVFDAVSSGQADMYHGVDYYFLNQHPAYALFSQIPFGMTPQEMNTWYYSDGGMELNHELGALFNLKPFLSGNTGAQAGGWFSRRIESAEDFNGLKFRMPGQGGQVLSKLGASVQNLPGAEVYQALASGAIDGTEWIGPWADEKAGFQEISKIYYPAGFHEPGPALTLTTNLDVFNELSASHQTIIETVCAASNMNTLSMFLSENAAALERLQSAGVELHEFPDDVWDAFYAASQEVIEESMGDDLYRRTYESAMASQESSSKWVNDSSGVFMKQRQRILG